jgi:hypothetical protein
VQSGLLGRQTRIAPVEPNEVWISPGVRALTALHQLGELLSLTTVVTPGWFSSVLYGIRLFLGQPLVQRLPPGLFGSGGAESTAAPVSVTRVPGVVAVSVEHCVLGAVTLKELADVITSGHVPTSELAASPQAGQAANGRLWHTLAPVIDESRSVRALWDGPV